MKRSNKATIPIILMLVIGVSLWQLGILSGTGLSLSSLFSSLQSSGIPSRDEASVQLEQLLRNVSWSHQPVKRREKIQLGDHKDLKETLPDIGEYPLVVDPPVSPGDVVVEMFITTTRSRPGVDGRMVDVAKAFNARRVSLEDGRRARVRVRKIASGTGYQYIASRKYLPDAFSPVHSLWIEMARSHGIPMTKIRGSMVRSVGGVVMKESIAKGIRATYGKVDIKSLINEVVQGNLAMGYTNPFASSTGLNFLLTVLSTFAGGDEAQMLSPEVVSTFERFQMGVPFVALTTLHMRDSVRNDGSLDAFIMGHQTFLKTAELQRGYEFIPFGIPHTHPLYAVGKPPPEKLEVLELLARFAEQPEYQRLAIEYGWNQPIAEGYKPQVQPPTGETLIQMQRLWKQKKDAGRPIAAVFLADISGSMAGGRINVLKRALLSGTEFISRENSIGLVLFNDEVRVVLPIKRFNLNQKAAFHAAVKDIDVGGGTAMYNGVLMSLSLLLEAWRNNPEVKPMLFVLTDGKTNKGFGFNRVRKVVQGINIPVYTIGYEADLPVLKQLSSLVEAASMNAAEGNVEYKIGSLLNAQM